MIGEYRDRSAHVLRVHRGACIPLCASTTEKPMSSSSAEPVDCSTSSSSSTIRIVPRSLASMAAGSATSGLGSTSCAAEVTGSRISITVPRLTSLEMRSLPPDCSGQTLHHRKAESCSLADALGREERFDGVGKRLGIHAHSEIGDAQQNISARRKPRFCRVLRRSPGAREREGRRRSAWRRVHSRRD